METKLRQVRKAEPERFDGMSSTGDASGMYIRQYKFPDTFKDDEILLSADSDRCFQWDYDHADAACDRHMGTGDLGIASWVRKATPADVIAFFADILKAEEQYPGVKWTGFRLTGTVNRSNGGAVFHLALFAKKPRSGTKVYTGQKAPNVMTFPRSHCRNAR